MDNELDAETTGQVQQHLQDCKVCQAELVRLQAIDVIIQTEVSVTGSPFLLTRIYARLKESGHRQSSGVVRKILPKSVVLATVAAGICVGVMLAKQLQNFTTPGISNFENTESYLDNDIFAQVPGGSLTEIYANYLPLEENYGGGADE